MQNDGKSKQVIIFRSDLPELKRFRGKAIAQGCHASLGAVLSRNSSASSDSIKIDLTDEEKEWFQNRFTKVCLSVENLDKLMEIYNKAKDLGLTVAIIKDAGFTAFNEPTITCIAIGPHYKEKIDDLTKDLKLY